MPQFQFSSSNNASIPIKRMSTPTNFPLRNPCPPGACDCERDTLLATPEADLRIMRLTKADELRLLERLENLTSLADLRHLELKMQQQIGLHLQISTTPTVRTLRGILIKVIPMPGLCRKTRQAVPAAIRRSLEKHPEIAFEIVNQSGLFASET